MPSFDHDELRDIIADLIEDNGLLVVLITLWNSLERDAAAIRTDQEREPYTRVLYLLDAAVKELQDIE